MQCLTHLSVLQTLDGENCQTLDDDNAQTQADVSPLHELLVWCAHEQSEWLRVSSLACYAGILHVLQCSSVPYIRYCVHVPCCQALPMMVNFGICRLAFLLIGLLDMVAVASSTILYFRTRHIYRTEYDELHQHDEVVRHSPSGSPNMGHAFSTSGVADS